MAQSQGAAARFAPRAHEYYCLTMPVQIACATPLMPVRFPSAPYCTFITERYVSKTRPAAARAPPPTHPAQGCTTPLGTGSTVSPHCRHLLSVSSATNLWTASLIWVPRSVQWKLSS